MFGQDNYYLSFDDTDYIDLGYSPILIQPEQVSVLAKVKMNQLTGHLDSQTIFFRNSAGGQIDLGYDEPLQSFFIGVKIGSIWYKAFSDASLQCHSIVGVYDRINSLLKIYNNGLIRKYQYPR